MKAVIARLNSYAEDDPAVKPLPLELPSFEKGIELDGASFSYDGEQTVLAEICGHGPQRVREDDIDQIAAGLF